MPMSSPQQRSLAYTQPVTLLQRSPNPATATMTTTPTKPQAPTHRTVGSISSAALTARTSSISSLNLDPDQRYRIMGLQELLVDGPMTGRRVLGEGSMMTNIGLRLDLQLPKLYVNFTSPWTDPSLELLNPELYLPRSYNTAEMNLPPPQQKMGSFSDMTLFYIFYTMPRDILQEAAAQELHNRSWRYHKDMKVWLVKDPQSADTIQKTANAERGRYVIFDPTLWKRLSQDMVIAYEALEERPSMINNAPTPSGFAAMPISQPSHLVHMSANAPQAYQQHPLLAHFLNAGNSTNGA